MASKKNMLQAQPISLALAVWSAIVMLVLWVLAQMGFYVSAAQAMMAWHMFFNFTFMGLVGGMVEAAVVSYLGAYLFVLIYNTLQNK